MRKIIVYPHSAMKPIILTDNEKQDVSVLKQKIIDVLNDNKVSVLETETDILIVRPSEIQAILITDKDIVDTPDNKKPNYDKRLNLDERKK